MALTTSELINYILAGSKIELTFDTIEEVKQFKHRFHMAKTRENKKMKAFGKAFELPPIRILTTEKDSQFLVTFEEFERCKPLNIKFLGVQDG